MSSPLDQALARLDRMLPIEAEIVRDALAQAERERDEALDDAVSAHSDADVYRRRQAKTEAELAAVRREADTLREALTMARKVHAAVNFDTPEDNALRDRAVETMDAALAGGTAAPHPSISQPNEWTSHNVPEFEHRYGEAARKADK